MRNVSPPFSCQVREAEPVQIAWLFEVGDLASKKGGIPGTESGETTGKSSLRLSYFELTIGLLQRLMAMATFASGLATSVSWAGPLLSMTLIPVKRLFFKDFEPSHVSCQANLMPAEALSRP